MVSKNLLEEMLKRNLKGELGGSMDSVLMENILIYAIEKVEEAEAQQREIEQLKTTIENLYKFNKQLIQENEPLQARVARMRTQLEIIKANIHEFPPDGMTIGKEIWIKTTEEAISGTNDYHNPADVKAMERAREALIIAGNMTDIGQFCACGKCNACGVDINYARREYCTDCARTIIDAAIAEIDKVLGGL